MKKLLSLLMMALSLTSISQVIPNKDMVVQVINGSGLDITGAASAIDRVSGAIYTCGFMNTVSNGRDLVVVKLDSNLVQQWVAQYDFNSGNDKGNAICIDGSGNVYVTGESEQSLGSNTDVITIKYNSSGTQQWATRLNGTANSLDCGSSIGVDGSSNVYIAGYTNTTAKGKDFFVSKLNSSGSLVSTLKRNGTANADESAEKLVIDGSFLYATGSINNTTTGQDIHVVCIALSGPSVSWTTTITGNNNGTDIGYDIKTDGAFVFISGKTNNTTTGDDYYFARLTKSSGAVKQSDTYDGGYNGTDYSTSLVADKQGNYVFTGIVTNGSNNEYHTRAIDTNSVLWTHVQPLNGAYTTRNPKVAYDTIAYHYYVSGAYYRSTLDGILYQIAPSGNKMWTQYHDGVGVARDPHIDLVLDGLGRIFVATANETGTSTGIYDYNLIRYNQTPVYMPVNYNMLADTFSMAHLFYPNSLEILDSTNTFVSDVLFYTKFAHPKEYIMKNKVAFCEIKHDSAQTNAKDTLNRVDMIFDGANEFSETFGVDFQDDGVLNYFLNYSGASGLTNVKGASHLIVPNIYPQIDLHYSSNSNGARYYFVVKPTGDPNNLRIRFDGAVSTTTVSNNLKVTTYLDEWSFMKPKVYNVSVTSFTNLSITTTTVTGTGNSRWVSLGSDTYSIDPGTYNTAWPLVIEFDKGITAVASPTNNLNWSTYYGDINYDDIREIKIDASNNLYVVGSRLQTSYLK